PGGGPGPHRKPAPGEKKRKGGAKPPKRANPPGAAPARGSSGFGGAPKVAQAGAPPPRFQKKDTPPGPHLAGGVSRRARGGGPVGGAGARFSVFSRLLCLEQYRPADVRFPAQRARLRCFLTLAV